MLAGKTVFITGSSRGIGREIALRCAKDGANVVIAAKTIEPHPKIGGTIYTVAKEVEAAGGRCLAVHLDLRDEQSIKEAVERTVERFGGIDVLINNASAISLTTVEDTPLKRYDLMHDINARGTFAMSKYAIPHLLRSSNPHILNISPPIELKRCWFEKNTAYTMSKYGMSLCMYGLAAQLSGHVAVNALWPKTTIWTAAMEMLAGEPSRKMSRKPSIMADAAYAIITKNVSTCCSGQFLIDEEVLRAEGIKNFDKYAQEPGNGLLADLFLPERVINEFEQHQQHQQQQILCMEGDTAVSVDRDGSIKAAEKIVSQIIDEILSVMTDKVRDEVNGIIHFIVTDFDLHYVAHIKSGSVPFVARDVTEKPDVTVISNLETFVGLARGRIKPVTAFLGGLVKIKGKMNVAIKLEKIFSRVLKSTL